MSRAGAASRILLPMDRVGPYELLELLGRGGLGRVYRAIHRDTGREVAVKLLHPELRDDPSRRRLVLNEVTAAARIEHPNVVAVIDAGLDRHGAPFLVTELVRGPQLLSFVAEWPGLTEVRAVLYGMLDGLSAAHAAGVLHRDLKPENVLVDRTGGGSIAKITDFGLARLIDPEPRGSAPLHAGTEAYMAPEQEEPGRPVGPPCDLFAVGVILRELLGGRTRNAGERLAPFRARAEIVPPAELAPLLDALVARDPVERPRFASVVRDQLDALLARTRERERRAVVGRADRMGSDTVPIGPLAGPISLAAMDEPREAIALGETEPAAIVRLRDPPIVGRDAELDAVRGAVSRTVRDGRSRVILLRGPSGIGKSRIARACLAWVEREALMEGLCVGYDASGGDPEPALRRELARVLGTTEQDRVAVGDADSTLALGAFLRGEGPAPPPDRAAAIAHAALCALGHRRPVYLWLDDVDTARDGAFELLERIARRPASGAIVAVATLRSSLPDGDRRRRLAAFARERSVSSVRVGKLTSRNATELIVALSGADEARARELAARSHGDPIAAIELSLSSERELRAARSRRSERRTSAATRSGGGRGTAALVEGRLDRLLTTFGVEREAAERALVAAAMLGVRFDDAAIRRASASALAERTIELALLAGLIRAEGGSRYRFDHPVWVEALLARGAAREDHPQIAESVARALIATYGADRPDVAARAAALYRDAGARDRAWDLLLSAETLLARAGDHEGALVHHRAAQRWLRMDARASRARDARALGARVHYTRAHALYFAMRYDEARRALARARASMEPTYDISRARCDALDANICFYAGDLARAEALARASLAVAGAHDRAAAVLGFIVWHRLGEIAALRGDFDGARTHLRRSRDHAVATGTTWRAQVADINLIELDLADGHLDDARERAEALFLDRDAAGDRHLRGEIVDTLARVELFTRREARARELLASRKAEVELLGDPWRIASLRLLEALASAALDDDRRARAAARRLRDAFDATPIDDAFTLAALDRLTTALDGRGLSRTARAIRSLETARARRLGLQGPAAR